MQEEAKCKNSCMNTKVSPFQMLLLLRFLAFTTTKKVLVSITIGNEL